MSTHTFAGPLRVEPSQSDAGGKLAIVDATGRLLFKTPSNRPSDRASADAVAEIVNQHLKGKTNG